LAEFHDIQVIQGALRARADHSMLKKRFATETNLVSEYRWMTGLETRTACF
jgi:hypothetical protein